MEQDKYTGTKEMQLRLDINTGISSQIISRTELYSVNYLFTKFQTNRYTSGGAYIPVMIF